MKIIIYISSFLISIASQAFPELIRYGYVNCTACHASPAGGGVLTSYGRGLSAELVSTWGNEKESELFHGALPDNKLNDWLLIGGDYRGLQYHYENNLLKEGRWIDMQGLIEIAAKIKNWTLGLAFGKFDTESHWQSVATRFYLQNQITDFLSLRVGRFTPQFGLNIPEHISPTRGDLGFGSNQERNSAEIQWSDENMTLTGTYSEAPDHHGQPKEKAIALRFEKVLSDTIKPGFSYWKGENPQFQRQILGLHSLFGWTQKIFWLTEIDWQEQVTKSNRALQHALMTYQKWGYEFHRGVIGLIVADGEWSHLEDPESRSIHYGLGFQFFPRPHFEIEGVWTREQAPQITKQEGDYAWLLWHYYL